MPREVDVHQIADDGLEKLFKACQMIALVFELISATPTASAL